MQVTLTTELTLDSLGKGSTDLVLSIIIEHQFLWISLLIWSTKLEFIEVSVQVTYCNDKIFAHEFTYLWNFDFY